MTGGHVNMDSVETTEQEPIAGREAVGRDGRPYEPPRVSVLGTLAEITLGHAGPKSDGINPGSLF
jgi:hypothetical protein